MSDIRKQVGELWGNGYTRGTIAEKLGITVDAARWHIEKCGVPDPGFRRCRYCDVVINRNAQGCSDCIAKLHRSRSKEYSAQVVANRHAANMRKREAAIESANHPLCACGCGAEVKIGPTEKPSQWLRRTGATKACEKRIRRINKGLPPERKVTTVRVKPAKITPTMQFRPSKVPDKPKSIIASRDQETAAIDAWIAAKGGPEAIRIPMVAFTAPTQAMVDEEEARKRISGIKIIETNWKRRDHSWLYARKAQ